MQNPNLEFEAVVVEKLERGRLTVSSANLVRTKKASVSGKYELNDILISQNTSVNLVTREAFFKGFKISQIHSNNRSIVLSTGYDFC